MRTSKAATFGYARQSQVPKLADTNPKLCKSCDRFFAARAREQRCDDCLTPAERLRRLTRVRQAELIESSALRGSPGRSRGLQQTHPTTPRRRVRPVAGQVSGTITDGGAMCREMAYERAELNDYPKGIPQRMSRAFAHAITLWNVNHGKQGRIDLERW